MAPIERIGEHRGEEWAIRMMAQNLSDELEHYIVKKELPYFRALMNAIALHPELYRRSGYSISEMRFSQHKRDRKGKIVSCIADFGGGIPTDAQIERACKIGVES